MANYNNGSFGFGSIFDPETIGNGFQPPVYDSSAGLVYPQPAFNNYQPVIPITSHLQVPSSVLQENNDMDYYDGSGRVDGWDEVDLSELTSESFLLRGIEEPVDNILMRRNVQQAVQRQQISWVFVPPPPPPPPAPV